MEQNRAKTEDKFENEEDYRKYFEEKYYAGFNKYIVKQMDDYTQYICTDYNDNYYVFNVYPDFSYVVMLDTYTLDLPQFIEKYNSASIQEKIVMNIDRFFKALNVKDYNFSYNCLAESFKNNKYNDISKFEKVIAENLFDNNKVEYGQFRNEGETYIYDIIVRNSENSAQIKKMQIIIKLDEGTGFKMSFNFR